MQPGKDTLEQDRGGSSVTLTQGAKMLLERLSLK